MAREPIEVIITHRGAATIGALGYPHEFIELGQLIGLSLKTRPASLIERVPIKTLQHHAVIVGGPTLGQHQHRQHRNKCSSKDLFHSQYVLVVMLPNSCKFSKLSSIPTILIKISQNILRAIVCKGIREFHQQRNH